MVCSAEFLVFCFQRDKYISMVKDEDKDGLFDQERQTESRKCWLLTLSILFALVTVTALASGVIFVVCGQFKPSSTPGPPPPCQDQCVYVFQGTKIFQYCTCPAGRVTYNFHSSCKHMHLSFKSVCNREHKEVIYNTTSSSYSSQSTRQSPIATKVYCFSRLLKSLRSLYGKQCGPKSSLFWVQAVCFYT